MKTTIGISTKIVLEETQVIQAHETLKASVPVVVDHVRPSLDAAVHLPRFRRRRIVDVGGQRPFDSFVHVPRHRRGQDVGVGVHHCLLFLPLRRRHVVGVGARCPLDAVVQVPRRRREHDVDVGDLH